MNLIVVMEVVDGLEYAPQHENSEWLWQSRRVRLVHELEYRAAGEERHDDPEVRTVDEGGGKGNDVGVRRLRHDLYFAPDVVEGRLKPFQVDDLDGDLVL